MPTFNRTQLMGHLGRAPELRALKSEGNVASFSIATVEWWKNKNGEKEERTDWHRVVVYGWLAERCAESLDKGSLVFVDGKLHQREYEDKTGAKRTAVEVVAKEVHFLSPRKDSARAAPPAELEPFTDDIPF